MHPKIPSRACIQAAMHRVLQENPLNQTKHAPRTPKQVEKDAEKTAEEKNVLEKTAKEKDARTWWDIDNEVAEQEAKQELAKMRSSWQEEKREAANMEEAAESSDSSESLAKESNTEAGSDATTQPGSPRTINLLLQKQRKKILKRAPFLMQKDLPTHTTADTFPEYDEEEKRRQAIFAEQAIQEVEMTRAFGGKKKHYMFKHCLLDPDLMSDLTAALDNVPKCLWSIESREQDNKHGQALCLEFGVVGAEGNVDTRRQHLSKHTMNIQKDARLGRVHQLMLDVVEEFPDDRFSFTNMRVERDFQGKAGIDEGTSGPHTEANSPHMFRLYDRSTF